ncbi:MAG: hypothetical protein N3A66_12155, partial [Planctomycetota bacterium]|nr:hypothetical protein [Planctomycetota bacterium]
MTIIREARESDVAQVRDLFARVYGKDYPFPGFYDTAWLTKAVYDDDTLFLVAEHKGEIIASGSAMLAVGGMSDLIAEIGRLVAEPSRRAAGAAQEVVASLIARLRERIHFSFAEARTIHPGSQRLAEACRWVAVGFEPLKYLFSRRESVVMYASVSDLARELRRNNPRVIPEAGVLAQTVLRELGLPAD